MSPREMMKMSHGRNLLVASALALSAFATVACGNAAPSAELKSARDAFAKTQASKAQQLVPDKVLEAKQALDKAEKAHEESSQSEFEKHFAYLAERRAQIAEVQGRIADAEKKKIEAEERYVKILDERRRKAETNAEKTSGDLAREREARLAAERKLAAALRSLEEIAKVKEESRGMVITLSGSVLFASDKSELLPIAKERLDQVATALQSTDPSQKIVVEGHTDSVGIDEYNMKLSEDRARSVRDYLVSRGVDSNRISAVGKGESVPVSDNTSPEGRANNRRVEIIVSPKGR